MINSKKQISEFIIKCYEFVENDYPHIFNRDKYFIVSNRGTFAFISLIGSLNKHETLNGNLSQASTIQYRFNSIVKYLKVLFNYISNSSSSESERYLSMLGSSADVKWLRYFQTIINNQFPDYNPPELIDWKERQDAELQDKGRKLGVEIEKYMKHMVIKTMKVLFEDNWELEVNSIKRECMKRAEEEKERNYKEGLEVKDIAWTEMFNINDYKSIILKYFTKKPEDYKRRTVADFKTFSDTFSIDIGEGLGSKSKRVKWISRFNSYRNLWAHEGTKEKRLNKNEVSFLQFIYDHFFNKPN